MRNFHLLCLFSQLPEHQLEMVDFKSLLFLSRQQGSFGNPGTLLGITVTAHSPVFAILQLKYVAMVPASSRNQNQSFQDQFLGQQTGLLSAS